MPPCQRCDKRSTDVDSRASPPNSRASRLGLLVSAAFLLAAASTPARCQTYQPAAYSLSVAGIDQTLPRDPLPFAAADRLGALDAIRFILGPRQIAVSGNPAYNNRAVNLPPSETTIDAAIRGILHQARLTYTFTGTAIEVSELARRTLTLPAKSTLPANLEGQIDLVHLAGQARQRLISIGARDLSVSESSITFLADAGTLERAEEMAASLRAAHAVIAYDAWIGAIPRPGSGPLRAPEGGRLVLRAPEEGMNVYIVPAGRVDMPNLVRAITGKDAPHILATPRLGAVNMATTTYLPPRAPRLSITPTLSANLLTTQLEIDRTSASFASAAGGTLSTTVAVAEGRPEDAIVITTHRSMVNPEAAGVVILKPRVLSDAELTAARPAAPSAPVAAPAQGALPQPALPQPALPLPLVPQPAVAQAQSSALQQTQVAAANPALPGNQLDAVKARLGILASGFNGAGAPAPSSAAAVPESALPVLPGQTVSVPPTPPAVQEAAMPVPPPEPFIAQSGRTLRDTLRQWAERSQWSVIWNTDRDYIIKAGATFNGDFVHAASELLRALAKARPSVKGIFYSGNRVLTVTTTEDEWTP